MGGASERGFCRNCGESAQEGDRFCVSCGEPLEVQDLGTTTGAVPTSGGEPAPPHGEQVHVADEPWVASAPGPLARLQAAIPVSRPIVATFVLAVVIAAGVTGVVLATRSAPSSHKTATGPGPTTTVVTSTPARPSAAVPTTSPATEPSPQFAAGSFTGRDPSTINFSSDQGNIVSNITWSSWTATQAVGQGTWTYISCVPDCASGQPTPYVATIALSNPVNGLFTALTETTAGPQGRVQAFSYPQPWPLAAS